MLRSPVWKNFEDLENNLTVGDLEQLVSKARDMEFEKYKILAGFQGIEIKDPDVKTWDELLDEARAKAVGVDQTQVSVNGHFNYIEEE